MQTGGTTGAPLPKRAIALFQFTQTGTDSATRVVNLMKLLRRNRLLVKTITGLLHGVGPEQI